jgi:hypothetical protein
LCWEFALEILRCDFTVWQITEVMGNLVGNIRNFILETGCSLFSEYEKVEQIVNYLSDREMKKFHTQFTEKWADILLVFLVSDFGKKSLRDGRQWSPHTSRFDGFLELFRQETFGTLERIIGRIDFGEN